MPRLSSDNYGAAVNVVTWFLLVTTLVTVITRTAMKWVIARKTNFDDAVILLASVFGIGESIAISLNVSNGLGQHVSQLTVFQQAGFEKSYYAAVLLYVPCVSLSKLAVLLLLRTITPVAAHRRIAYTTGVATIAWAGVAEVVLAFQCQVPNVWGILGGQCINLVSVCSSSASSVMLSGLLGFPFLFRIRRPLLIRVLCSSLPFGTGSAPSNCFSTLSW